MPITHGLPEDPDLTFTMVSPSAPPPTSPDLPALQTWTVIAHADETQTLVGGAAATTGTDQANQTAAYRLLRQIGQGAMGEVWEAEQTSLGRTIAVKRLRRKDGQQVSENLLREADFRSESVIAASLEHPNILPVYDFGRDADGDLLLAMKRVHGTPWKDQLRAEFADTPVDSFLARHIPILMAVTQAVAFAHSRGIIHRDLKPAQVLVGAFGEVLLTDWGLAIQIADRQGPMRTPPRAFAPTPATATNPAGTPSLMAPEQTETHGGNLGPWTDVYLLGGTLYYLLTGHYPHASESSEAAFAHARNGRVQPPSARAPERLIPAELEQLCLKALEPDKADRLPTAEAFLKGLEDYQRGTARKQKSAELVTQVEQRFDAGEPDYAGYTAAIATLDEARRLWPDNPSLPALRQRTLHDSARLALRQGDLSFARLQCEAMTDGDDARSLHRAIDVRQRQVARRRFLLRFTAAAVFVLLIVIAGGALMFSRRMQAANKAIAQHAKQTEQALKIAKTRSAGAFDLINFVLNDLKKAMDQELTPAHGVTTANRNLIASAIAGKVANPVATYFNSIKSDAWPKDMQMDLSGQLRKVGRKLDDMGREKEASDLLQRSVAIREHLSGPDSADLITPLNNLASTYERTGEFTKAMATYRRALAIAEARLAPTATARADVMLNMANDLKLQAKYAQSEAMYRRAVAIYEKNDNPQIKLHLAVLLTNLGSMLDDDGKPAEAEPMLRHALDLWHTYHGDKYSSGGVSLILAGLSNALADQGRYAEAEPLLRKALTNFEAIAGPQAPVTGILLRYLGTQQRQMHHFQEADKTLRRALKIEQSTFGPDSHRTAQVLVQLGMLQHQTHHNTEAAATLRHAETIFKQALGANNSKTAWANYQLALVLEDTHHPHEAQKLLQGSAHVLHDTLGAQNPKTLAAQKSLDAINIHAGKQ